MCRYLICDSNHYRCDLHVNCQHVAFSFHFIPWNDVVIGVTQIVNLIPIAPGGFGVGEAAFAKVLTLMNPGVLGFYATIF